MSLKTLFACGLRSPVVAAGILLAGFCALPIPAIAQAQTIETIEECNQFADLVNRNQEILEAFEVEINRFSANAVEAETLDEIRQAASQYVAAVNEVTDNLATLATDLEGLAIADGELSIYRDDYITVVSGFSEALDVVSGAMAEVADAASEAELSENLEAVQTDTTAAIEQIDELAIDESDLLNDFNVYCGAS